MTGPLNDRSPITRTRDPSKYIHAFATMDGHNRRGGSRETEPLLVPTRTGVLLDTCAVARGGASNLETLATMGGDQLEGVGSRRRELELLIPPTVTTALHRPNAIVLGVTRDFQALVTVSGRE